MVLLSAKRKTHTAAFEAQVARAAVQGDRTGNEPAAQFGVHPTLIRAQEEATAGRGRGVFPGGRRRPPPGDDTTPELYERIGRLEGEFDGVEKNAAPFGGPVPTADRPRGRHAE